MVALPVELSIAAIPAYLILLAIGLVVLPSLDALGSGSASSR
jgi:hypothetical protein